MFKRATTVLFIAALSVSPLQSETLAFPEKYIFDEKIPTQLNAIYTVIRSTDLISVPVFLKSSEADFSLISGGKDDGKFSDPAGIKAAMKTKYDSTLADLRGQKVTIKAEEDAPKQKASGFGLGLTGADFE